MKEQFRKVSTTVLKNAQSDVGDWSGLLPNHRNMTSHQIVIVSSGVLAAGEYQVRIIPDTSTKKVRNSIPVSKVISLAGKNSGLINFTGVIKGIHLRAAVLPSAGETISVVVSSYSRVRRSSVGKTEKDVDHDYVSTDIATEIPSDFGGVSKTLPNHRNMIYHQLSVNASGALVAGEYRVRFIPDSDDVLEGSVDTGKTLKFDNDTSAFVQFGGVMRGIHLEPVTIASAGYLTSISLSSSVERFDEIIYEYIGDPPTLGGDFYSHINNFNNPHQTSWGNLLARPPNVMSWAGMWEPREYQQLMVVWDRPYTMIANKVTSDRAAPQLIGDPEFLMPAPTWNNYFDMSSVWSGHSYLFTEPGHVNAVRVWPPSANDTYRLMIILNPAAVQYVYRGLMLTPDQWNVVQIDTVHVYAGDTLLVYLNAESSGPIVEYSGNWIYEAISDLVPPENNWNRNGSHTVLRFSKIAPYTMDVELAALETMDVELDFEVEFTVVGLDTLGTDLMSIPVGSTIRLSQSL